MSSTGKHFCAGMDLATFSNGVNNIPDDKKPDPARVGEALYRSAKELQDYISTLEKNYILLLLYFIIIKVEKRS